MTRTIEQQPGAIGIGPRQDPRAQRARERRQRRLKLTAIKDGDRGTPELARRHKLGDDITSVEGVDAVVKRVTDQRLIDCYRLRGDLDEAQWRAADKVAALAFRAGQMPRVTLRYSDLPRSPGTAETAALGRDQARADYLDAMAVLGSSGKLASVVVAVCVTDQSAANWAAAHGVYRGQKAAVEGMTTLRLALDRLVAHWRLR
ncbi:MAG TPA: DUF6456 domain-containing protein [Vineibacter sp.]|nr:DUF6456 domain-containing protein [Vineibacter sp.]